MDAFIFWLLGAVLVVASVLVVAQRNPMYSVLLLITSFAALSGLYVTLQAPFVAMIQIIIYAGAIMVLFLFVVMLLNVPAEEALASPHSRLMSSPFARRFGAGLSAVLAIELALALSRLGLSSSGAPETGEHVPDVYDIGVKLFRDYAFAFEATSVLILVAMVGAIVLARKETH